MYGICAFKTSQEVLQIFFQGDRLAPHKRAGKDLQASGHYGAKVWKLEKCDPIELLVLWWRYERSHDLSGMGYPKICPSCAGYQASRQYDDTNGADATDALGKLAIHIGHAVDRVEQPWRTALHVTAKNHAMGLAVWTSARLPEDKDARAAMFSEAIEMFCAQVGGSA